MVVGSVVTIKFVSSSSQDKKTTQQLEDDLNKAIKEDAKRLSGCFLVDGRNNTSTLVDILSCDQSTTTSSVQKAPICTDSDKNCSGKFNPCLDDSLPSQCKRLVVRTSSIGNPNEIQACQMGDTICSKYCDSKYFKLEPGTSLECRDIDGNRVALEVFSSITGLSIPEILEKIKQSIVKGSRFNQVLVGLNVVVFLIVLVFVYKMFFLYK